MSDLTQENLTEGIPVEEILSFTTRKGNTIRNNCFIIHPRAGKHPFHHAEAAKGTIYNDLIWPWVERIGKARTKQKRDSHYLKPTCEKANPYPYWTFYMEGPNKKIKIKDALYGERWLDRKVHIACHELVGKAFIIKPENFVSSSFCLNHKNEIKADYRVSNLEWVTRSKNSTGTRKDLTLSLDERYLRYKNNKWI